MLYLWTVVFVSSNYDTLPNLMKVLSSTPRGLELKLLLVVVHIIRFVVDGKWNVRLLLWEAEHVLVISSEKYCKRYYYVQATVRSVYLLCDIFCGTRMDIAEKAF